MEEQNKQCAACGKDTNGYKCGGCGMESAEGGECCGAECAKKCVGCNEGEGACACAQPAE